MVAFSTVIITSYKLGLVWAGLTTAKAETDKALCLREFRRTTLIACFSGFEWDQPPCHCFAVMDTVPGGSDTLDWKFRSYLKSGLE